MNMYSNVLSRIRLNGALGILCLVLVGIASYANAQTLTPANPISAVIPSTSFSLELEEVIKIPDSSTGNNRFARIEQITPAIDGSSDLFVSDQRGKLYSFALGDSSPTEFYNFGANIPNFRDGNQSGLRGFAFHPNAFANSGDPGYRKMYTAQDTTHPTNGHTSVVSEWTINASGTGVVAGSRRDILSQTQPRGDHNIGKVAFNHNLAPADPDYGNLYISFGDGGNYRSAQAGGSDTMLNPNAQDTTNFLGSILRIDPLQDGANPYTVPVDNPFVGQAGFNPEIWAYGLRNPHQFSWDTGGNGDMLIADIGQSNIEELNIGVAGANYGWAVREGTYDVAGKAPDNPMAVDVLSPGHTTDPYTYPVVQYDHDGDNTGQNNAAIAGGFVYRGTQVPELQGKYIFGNFGTFGNFGKATDFQDIYAVDVNQLQMRDDFTNVNSLSNGFLAPMEQISLIDSSSQPIQLLDLVRQASGIALQGRTDMRFGTDANGEIYVSSKKDGWIRRFVTTVPPPTPDTIEFDNPDYSNGGLDGQQGWNAESGWDVEDAAGAGDASTNNTNELAVFGAPVTLDQGESYSFSINFQFEGLVNQQSNAFTYTFQTGLKANSSASTHLPLNTNGQSGRPAAADVTLQLYSPSGDDNYRLLDNFSVISGLGSIDASEDGDLDGGDILQVDYELTLGADAASTTIEVLLQNLTDGSSTNTGTITGIDTDIYNALTGAGAYLFFQADNYAANNSGITGVQVNSIAIVSPDDPAIPGDFDGDGFVGLSDLNILGANWGIMGGATVAMGDANGDGNIDLADLNILGSNWNPPPAIAIPEPTVLPLAIAAMMTLAPVWRMQRPGPNDLC